MNIDKKLISELADKYANECKFKSDFPHHEESSRDGFIEGFNTAILNKLKS
jgi:hypothetical protein